MKQVTNRPNVAIYQRIAKDVGEVAHALHRSDGRSSAYRVRLSAENAFRFSPRTKKEEHECPVQFGRNARIAPYGFNSNSFAVRKELYEIQAPESCGVLILATNRLTEHFNLYPACLGGQSGRRGFETPMGASGSAAPRIRTMLMSGALAAR